MVWLITIGELQLIQLLVLLVTTAAMSASEQVVQSVLPVKLENIYNMPLLTGSMLLMVHVLPKLQVPQLKLQYMFRHLQILIQSAQLLVKLVIGLITYMMHLQEHMSLEHLILLLQSLFILDLEYMECSDHLMECTCLSTQMPISKQQL